MDCGNQIIVGERLHGGAAEQRLAGQGGYQRRGRQVQFPGTQMTGDQRSAQPLFPLVQGFDAGTRLILSLPAFESGTGDADEGGGMERPFQEGHIAEQFRQSGGVRIALQPTATVRQDDKGQIRPTGLRADPEDDRAQVGKRIVSSVTMAKQVSSPSAAASSARSAQIADAMPASSSSEWPPPRHGRAVQKSGQFASRLRNDRCSLFYRLEAGCSCLRRSALLAARPEIRPAAHRVPDPYW